MNSTLSQHQLEHLENEGYVVIDTANEPTASRFINCQELQKLSYKLYQLQYFKTATIVEAKNNEPIEAIRNDFTLWIDEQNWPKGLSQSETEVLKNYWQFIKMTQETLKNYFRLSLNSFETHFAIYPKGHFYKKHIDQTATNNRRYVSFVLYLNENWIAADGGQLVGYKNQEKIFSVLPESAQMIIFLSSLEHEVLPAMKDRFSITGWFRND